MPARSVNGCAFVVLAGGLAPTTMSTDQVVQALQGTFRRVSYAPPMLPRVAIEILRLSQAPVTIELSRDIEPLLAQDPLLTAQVLRAANAPGMGAKKPIRSIRQAVTRLGLRGLRDVVITVSLRSRVFRTPSYQAELDALFSHSMAMATISQRVAQTTKGDARFAYLCGLLADLGIASSLLVFGELPEGAPPLFSLWPAMLEVHEEAAATVGQAWRLPEEVVAVIGAHHRTPSGPHARLQSTLAVAEEIAVLLGLHLGCQDPSWASFLSEERFTRARDALGVTPSKFEAILDQCAGELAPPKRVA
ncbi:MAG: HD-like signal output (HDOD) protein [Cognaticolwellia sp.]|jgi:HD-like signal output (HDOD) protein